MCITTVVIKTQRPLEVNIECYGFVILGKTFEDNAYCTYLIGSLDMRPIFVKTMRGFLGTLCNIGYFKMDL